MNEPKKAPAGVESSSLDHRIPVAKLSAGLRRLLESMPEREWYRIRSFLIQSDEEGQVAEMLPLMRRAMDVCPPKMIARIRAKEITGNQVDDGYRQLHASIHGVRDALFNLFELAGVSLERPGIRASSRKALPGGPKEPAPPGTAAMPAPRPLTAPAIRT